MSKTILWVLLVVCMIVITGFAFNTGVKKTERLECQEWEREVKVYEGWYALDWQKEQCLNYGIELE